MKSDELWPNDRILQEWSKIYHGVNLDKEAMLLLRRIRDELQVKIDTQEARIIELEKANKEAPWCQICGAPAKHVDASSRYIATYCDSCFVTLKKYLGELER